jgi:hypothetical protein
MLHNIFRSDPEARPIAPVAAELFNPDIAASAAAGDAIMVSLAAEVARGDGARAIDAAVALQRGVACSSYVAFFHPLAPQTLRIFFVAPVTPSQTAHGIADKLAALSAPDSGVTAVRGHAAGASARADLQSAFAAAPGAWTLVGSERAGHILHPTAGRDARTDT